MSRFRVTENKLQFLCERNPGEIDFGMSYQESTLYEKPCFLQIHHTIRSQQAKQSTMCSLSIQI